MENKLYKNIKRTAYYHGLKAQIDSEINLNKRNMSLSGYKLKYYREFTPYIDYHLHTNWTDAKDSIEDMVYSSFQKGLSCIAFTEHVRESSNWYHDFYKCCKKIEYKYNNKIKIIIGTESRISDLDGNISINDEILKMSQLVMASFHSPISDLESSLPSEYIKQELDATIAACSNKYVHIIGHPMAMSIKKFNIRALNEIELIIINAKKNNKVFEINFEYHKNILKELIELCEKYCVKVSVGSNAHSTKAIGQGLGEFYRLIKDLDK